MTPKWLMWTVAVTFLFVVSCRPKSPPSRGSEPAPPPAASVAAQPAAPTPPAASTQPAVSALTPVRPKPDRLVVYIQPLGEKLPDVDVAFVEQSLRAFYDIDVRLLDRIALPAWTKNDARTRYRAEKLLDVLEKQLPADGDRILGLTGVDISTTKGPYADWGILGLATIDGSRCVISKFRTKRGTKTALQARIRLGKVAVHEIGHTLGLEHCPTVGCLMEDAHGTVLTCDREYDLCDRCRHQLAEAGYELTDGEIPWPKPR